jgi:hypothetical protein
MLGKGFYAHLDQHKIRQAEKAATDRRAYARSIGRTESIPDSVDKASEDLRGALCERAAWVFFPSLEWHAFKTGPLDELPDIGSFIDVKGIKLDRHELLVKVRNIKPNWAYLLVSAENHPYYLMCGFKWGCELIADAPKKHNAPPCYAWPSDRLRPFRELLFEVTYREGINK